MANKKDKAPEIVKFLDGFAKTAFGTTRSEALKGKTCVKCRKPADKFKDKISEKEFGISGLCQVCQDEIFG